jgi:hypothetical protein
MYSGSKEGLIYSLSRWTDLPAAKWSWFTERLRMGWMYGIDPRTGIPTPWSLSPVDTLGMVFWTRQGSNLVTGAKLLRGYRARIHFTLTGWAEVEHRAPDLPGGIELLRGLVGEFGADTVTWRFSPVPLVSDVVARFTRIADEAARLGLTQVYLSFLQDNDLVPETRAAAHRRELLTAMASSTNLELVLCNEDRQTLAGAGEPSQGRVRGGVCEDGLWFSDAPGREGCGCALAVDPFTRNEACVYGCTYCYAADASGSPRKRNTTLTTLRRSK